MLDTLQNLAMGFGLAITPTNLLFAFIGSLLGTLIGVLPGIGPLATISMLLSLTVTLDPVTSLIMLSAIFYGAQYGGSTTAILCNLPGEATSVITAVDGYQMALKGRAGAALATAALSSLLAGCIATALIALLAPPLARFALNFNAPEIFALMALGLLACVIFSPGSFVKALAMALLGVLLGLVGSDVETGAQRMTLGIAELSDGLSVVALAIGLFGLNEIISNLSRTGGRQVAAQSLNRLWLSGSDFKLMLPAALRGTAFGSILGVLPGGGMTLSTFASYMLERKIAKDPSQFGAGAIQGVAAPEAANNAAAQTSFIPLLTLGIPASPIMALLLGAMIIQGIQPGADVMIKRPDLFWGLIASMWVGNVMLVIINLPMIGIWVRLLKVPYDILFPAIVIFCCIGSYSIGLSIVDLLLMAAFTGVGTVALAVGYPLVPLLLGFVLGPLAEENLRRAMALANGDVMVFIERPVSAVIVGVMALLVLSFVVPVLRRARSANAET
jgi:TctA family transporter